MLNRLGANSVSPFKVAESSIQAEPACEPVPAHVFVNGKDDSTKRGCFDYFLDVQWGGMCSLETCNRRLLPSGLYRNEPMGNSRLRQSEADVTGLPFRDECL